MATDKRAHAGQILPLSPDAIAQIKSSTSIISLTGVVLALLRNSFDAQATKVHVVVDFKRGGCTVEDDGLGIPPGEFLEAGGLGKLHYTSKYETSSEVDSPPLYGRHGMFLASLGELAIVNVTSHHYLHRSHNTLLIHRGKQITRTSNVPTSQLLRFQDHGTRVSVRDLFGNMPVRVKQRGDVFQSPLNLDREWDNLRREVIALLLAWNRDVHLSLEESEGRKALKILTKSYDHRTVMDERSYADRTKSILTQSSIVSPTVWSSWVPIAGSTSSIDLEGVISLEASATKQVQYISLAIDPIRPEEGSHILYEEINRIFSASSFGVAENGSGYDFEGDENPGEERGKVRTRHTPSKRAKARRERVDKWPMFCIRILPRQEQGAHLPDADHLFEDNNALSTILQLLEAVVTEFLIQNHFQQRRNSPRRSRKEPWKDPGNKLDLSSHLPLEEIPLVGRWARRSQQSNSRASLSSSKINELSREVKIPSFSKESYCSSFEEISDLSKIKSSNSRCKERIFNGGHRKDLGRGSPQLESPDLLVDDDYFQDCDFSQLDLIQPLGNDGSVWNESLPENSINIPCSDQLLAVPETRNGKIEDVTLTWIDPISKKTYNIDARTGMIVPDNNTSITSAERPLSRRLKLSSRQERSSPASLPSVLEKWENPIFQPAQQSIPRVSSDALDRSLDLFQDPRHVLTSPSRLSKESLRNAQIIAQVDKKFILIKLKSGSAKPNSENVDIEGNVLVIVDQHAADERCRVEELYAELCVPATPDSINIIRSDLGYSPGVRVTKLASPLQFDVAAGTECDLFEREAPHFARWGIVYNLNLSGKGRFNQISVIALPVGIAERCRSEVRVLIDLMRTEVWERNEGARGSNSQPPSRNRILSADSRYATPGDDWLRLIGECPRGILDMLNSRSCRSAVMFNDELSLENCRKLLLKLARCAFPFQCAHGRPSMVPLVNLEHGIPNASVYKPAFGNGNDNPQAAEDPEDLQRAFREWSRKKS